MSDDLFNDTLDGALRGKYVRVHTDAGVFEGWVARVHHERGSVVLHDATNTTTEESIGSVFIRVCEVVEVLRPKKRIEFRSLDDLHTYPDHDVDLPPEDELIRLCYRNQFPGSFPVVRESGTILNGHKRVAAAKLAGLERLPVEVISVTDQQAAELFRVAHRGDEIGTETTDKSDEGTPAQTSDAESDTADRGTEEETEQENDSGPAFGYDH